MSIILKISFSNINKYIYLNIGKNIVKLENYYELNNK
jgi:hypothetical protein